LAVSSAAPVVPPITAHAVIGLTKSAAKEYGPKGIRVNAVLPGTIETPMVTTMVATGALDYAQSVEAIPLGRLGRTDEIASTVLWLCSPGASFISSRISPTTSTASLAPVAGP